MSFWRPSVIKELLETMNRKSTSAAGIWASLLLAFLLSFFAPVQAFLTNLNDFSFDFYDMAGYLAVLLILSFCFLFLITLLCRAKQKIESLWLVFLCTSILAFYLQGTFFTSWLPTMDGSSFDWRSHAEQRWISLLLWAVPFCLSFALCKTLKAERFRTLISFASKAGLLFLLITMTLSIATTKNAMQKKTGVRVSSDHILTMSDDTNFIIVLLDCIDSHAFTDIILSTPSDREVLNDFTFYRNTVGSYNLTSHAVPYLLTGKWYENQEPYSDYLTRETGSSSLFQVLKEHNYRMGLYDDTVSVTSFALDNFDNIYPADSFSAPFKFCKMMIKLVGFRYLPFDCKPYCLLSPEDIYFDTLKGSPEESVFSWDNREFYQILQRESIEHIQEKNFRFIHLQGGHGGWQYNEFLEPVGQSNYEYGIKGSVFALKNYFQMLKEAGVYDNSVIFVLADHGANLVNEVYRSNPILLIKGFHEAHPLAVSDAPLSHEDIMEAYFLSLDGCQSDELFSWQEGDERTRRYLIVNDNEDLVEMMQSGYAMDEETFSGTGVVYPHP